MTYFLLSCWWSFGHNLQRK